MSTAVLHRLYPCKISACDPTPEVKKDPQFKPYSPFHQATHSTLNVCEAIDLRTPDKPIQVNVFDACKGTKEYFDLKSTDTIGKLQQEYLKIRPEMVGSLNLAYNGKPIQLQKTLGEIGVKAGAMFVCYQKCIGG